MNIDQQLQLLIEQAPDYGMNPGEMKMVTPVFKTMASQLQHSQYYILQNLDQAWVMTVLQHRTQPSLAKNVIYAYSSLEILKTAVATLDPQVIALPMPVIQVLFQLLAMKPIDSIIFFDALSSRLNPQGHEISRQMLRTAIEKQVRSIRSNPPPNIA